MVVHGMIKSCGRAVIVICCDGKEMWSTDQVREMISGALLDDDIVDANIVTVEDCPDDSEWVDKVLEAAGRPENPIVWSGEPDIRAMFEEKGVRTQKVSPVPGISNEDIREKVKAGDSSWTEKVPKDVARVIRQSQ